MRVQIFRTFWRPKLDSHEGCQDLLVSDGLGCVEMAAWWFVGKLDRLLAMWLAWDPLARRQDKDWYGDFYGLVELLADVAGLPPIMPATCLF